MTSEFDPERTRAEQGLPALPKVASLSGQRQILTKLGLRDKTVSNDTGVWIVVERVPSEDAIASLPTLCKHNVDLKVEICTTCLGTDDIAAYDTKQVEALKNLPSQNYYAGRVFK
jgi:hypothetical protein